MGGIEHHYLSDIPSQYGRLVVTKEVFTRSSGLHQTRGSTKVKQLPLKKCDAERDFVGGGVLGSEWRSSWWKTLDLSSHWCIDKSDKGFDPEDLIIKGNSIFSEQLTSVNIKL